MKKAVVVGILGDPGTIHTLAAKHIGYWHESKMRLKNSKKCPTDLEYWKMLHFFYVHPLLFEINGCIQPFILI